MTSEVVLMNSHGVAMAADSAVTLSDGSGITKIHQSANKLFTLSKSQPIGIMIYNAADIYGVPWETLIKLYREELGTTSFKTVSEYSKHFFKFLVKNEQLFPLDVQKGYFVKKYVNFLHENLYRAAGIFGKDLELINSESFEEEKRKEIVTLITDQFDKNIKEYKKKLKNVKKIEVLKKFQEKDLSESLEKIALQAFKEKDHLKILNDRLLKEAYRVFLAKHLSVKFSSKYSGIVIAGYGTNEIFPNMESFIVEELPFVALRYKKDRSEKVDHTGQAKIIPLADSEIIDRFINGISHDYRDIIANEFIDTIVNIPDKILDSIEEVDSEKRKNYAEKFSAIIDDIIDQQFEKLQHFEETYFKDEIRSAISILPKDELAAAAEAMVNLSSFKKKVSLQHETVGGPVDVAVISKGDGLVWIKRKHYFNPDRNFHFFNNNYPSIVKYSKIEEG